MLVDVDTNSPAEWAANRVREFGGWRWMKHAGAGQRLQALAARWSTGTRAEDVADLVPGELEPRSVGYLRLLEVLGDEHRELCVELGRWAELCALPGYPVESTLGRYSARFASSGDPEALLDGCLWGIRVLDDELEQWGEDAAAMGFDTTEGWVCAAIDVMADRQIAPFGMREGIVESGDTGAHSAPVQGLLDLMEAWDDGDDLSQPYLVDHLEDAARYARMTLALHARQGE